MLHSPIPIRRLDVLREARTWIGTRWVHRQHVKGGACDCAGLIVETIRSFMPDMPFDYPNYSALAKPGQFKAYLDSYLEPIDLKEVLPADVLLFRIRRTPTHVAFLANWQHDKIGQPFSLIHAMRDIGCVKETPYGGEWPSLLTGAWRIPGAM